MRQKVTFLDKLFRSKKTLYVGTGSSLGLLAASGLCSAGCGVGAVSLAGVFAALGMGALAVYLPYFKIPLLTIASFLAFLVIRQVNREKNPTKSSIVSCLLTAALAFGGYQTFKPSSCGMSTDTLLSKFTPETQKIVRKGIYTLWPKLGRAPSVEEIRVALNYPSSAPVLSAFEELKAGGRRIFYEGTSQIRWLWPLSSIDHGITVHLEGEKSVFARCAVDALGMSQMYGRIANITATSPLRGEKISFTVDGKQLKSGKDEVIVSDGDSCDDLLFFSSKDEFEQFKREKNRTNLYAITLQQAFDRGIKTFGKLLEGS